VPLASAVRAASRFVRLAPRARAIVLLYHRVADLEADPQALAVSPRRFAEHLEVVRTLLRPVALSDVARGLGGRGVPRRSVALTFDDGYADNLHVALPLLEKHDVPATVYVAAGAIGCARETWWDELERVVLWPRRLPVELTLELDGRTHRLEGGDHPGYEEASPVDRRWSVLDEPRSPRQRLYRDLERLLHPLAPGARASALERLRAWAGVGASGRATHRTLSREEIVRLGRSGLVDIGAHTVTHPRLSSLDVHAQREEVRRSKASLEEIAGRPVTSFAYPYGYRGSYDPDTVEIVGEAGFTSACSNFPGLVLARTGRYELPRFLVRDWDGDTFAANLRRWYRLGG
jgi:peptidoglycan/xylan/chitin deacetylase (PgdA/CDA1 family)